MGWIGAYSHWNIFVMNWLCTNSAWMPHNSLYILHIFAAIYHSIHKFLADYCCCNFFFWSTCYIFTALCLHHPALSGCILPVILVGLPFRMPCSAKMSLGGLNPGFRCVNQTAQPLYHTLPHNMYQCWVKQMILFAARCLFLIHN